MFAFIMTNNQDQFLLRILLTVRHINTQNIQIWYRGSQCSFFFYFLLTQTTIQMARDSIESDVSLLTKCYPYGTLPPEVDNEGNIEYKVRIICYHARINADSAL